MMNWLRLYSEFASDAKVQSMPEAMQRRLIMLFCFRCSNVLATLHDDELAFALRISESDLAETKALFERKGFIDSGWNILKWDERQYVSDSSTERSRKHRESKKEGMQRACNVAETPPDTDTDTEKALSLSSERDGENDVSPPAVVGRKERKKPECPIQDIVAIYREVLPGHPDVFKLSAKRKARITARWRDDLSTLDDWRSYFLRVRESNFLTGRVVPINGHRKPFIADLDWLVSEENMIKVVEGKYFS